MPPIIRYHAGCAETLGCFGPKQPYFTVFNTETRFLGLHFLASIGIAIIIFLLTKKQLKSPSAVFLAFFSFSCGIVSFFLLAYFFPVKVFY